ncbi:ThuA domain-containing protein [Arachidicoccus terrestris]|uniref:ThuA domain-containing protein n=1 Tax=Arachidicoccus terrestris TaxID=2875539 RepID=UPI001CC528D8|nr:ThuA domain-containing protein [Arachidicoccus terrestris]UAY54149.1 ThuA domain-containing protein [Arachidicoccus terrestris]
MKHLHFIKRGGWKGKQARSIWRMAIIWKRRATYCVYLTGGRKAGLLLTAAIFLLCHNGIFGRSLHPKVPPYPEFKVLILYSNTVEPDHVDFKRTAIAFFNGLQEGREFDMDTSADMETLCTKRLSDYSLIIMLNDFPHTEQQRIAFQQYMEKGGGWLGFHVAGYNDASTHWPWLVHFLGGAVFDANSWPPVPAKLVVEAQGHPVTRTLPSTFISPSNEWYRWKPSPRLDSNVQVLVSLSDENYPLGLKDILRRGDNPVVWTNKAYRMVYINMGHGGAIFTDATQNRLIINAFRWLVSRDPKGNVFK